jgi:hypothetical protein
LVLKVDHLKTLPLLLHLQIALDGFDPFRVTRDPDGLVRLGLTIHCAGHPDNVIPVCVDTDVFKTSEMLGREPALDFRRNGGVLDERSRVGAVRIRVFRVDREGASIAPITKQVVAILYFMRIS